VRPRHSDADLLELAATGSAPAFASLIHRHRDVLQRGAVRAARPEVAAETALVAAVRDLRRGRLRDGSVRDRLTELMEDAVRQDRGQPGVERLLPPDWFDRVWVRVEERWPTGRRPLRTPRWTGHVFGAGMIAAVGVVGTLLVVTTEVTTEVVSELVAEPVDEVGLPSSSPSEPVEGSEPTESPELFGDVELGELPIYDLTGDGGTGRAPTDRPTFAPPPEDDARDADGDPQADDAPRSAEG